MEIRMSDWTVGMLVEAGVSAERIKSGRLGDIDLSGVKKAKVYLTDCDLRTAKFREASMPESDFSRANCRYADFRDAYLEGSDFVDTELNQASLYRANLVRCDFSGADLTGASFHSAVLWKAYFGGADLTETDFANAKGIVCGQIGGTKFYVTVDWARIGDVEMSKKQWERGVYSDVRDKLADVNHGATIYSLLGRLFDELQYGYEAFVYG